MTEPLFFATTAIAQQATAIARLAHQSPEVAQRSQQVQAERARLERILRQLRAQVRPETQATVREFGHATGRPQSGSQLFAQRTAALPNRDNRSRFLAQPITQPITYQQWRSLLAQEAKQLTGADQPLGVLLGDSLSLWFPGDRLPAQRFWLNQAISGDTTGGILKRLSAFAHTRPQVIYLMAGINDLKTGASDQTIVQNLRQILQQLRQTHPQTQIVMQSILPTRSLPISNQRILSLNRQLQAIARQQGAYYLDVNAAMADATGNLRPDLTTDGLHLNPNGYAIWQAVLQQADTYLANR